MTSRNHPALLPNGLLDLLPPFAEHEAATIALFMKQFSAFGYLRVKPPLVEFEESLLGDGPGSKLARQTFRMMDPVSQRMMGVRADATAQIARIATSRLGGEKRPLRLSYAADVLRVNGTQLRPERQFCQVGCELVGADDVVTDVEMPLVALKALSAAKIENLSVDLTVPTLVSHLYDETNAGEDEREALNDLIEKRDLDGIKKVGTTSSSLIAAMLEQRGAFDVSSLPAKAAADMTLLRNVAAELRAALDIYGLGDVQVTVDPLERRGFEYQTGVSFTLFARGARGELGRGGRYDIAVVGKDAETATGFTLYMDTILRAAPDASVSAAQNVPADTGWAEIKSLQDKGLSVSRQS
ncbi:MAG: ATP phosphoribosyltransferase regulatory subunit [Micavibrio aeruginosavorus]|uniref:Histidine--tRNA ligase n=1 Tax=Micavibrio aeruginosavorus TaxID=349221 RepID=A0A2W5BX05_9BACT|nr:MAG: ATP phosphoribosyltransferase regulatory subunit [Micavibrio aeruginosavorus]